jgi:hypothetical protein
VLNDVKPMPFQTYHPYNYYQYGEGAVYASAGKESAAKTLLKG